MASPAFAPLKLLPPTWKNLFYPPEKGEYVYFQHRKDFPFLAANCREDDRYLVKGAWAADAAMLAYGRHGETPMTCDEVAGILQGAGFTQQEHIGNWAPGAQGTQGFFAANDEFAILSFRGTERGDLEDIKDDGTIVPVPEPPVSFPMCVAHLGFQTALNRVRNEVENHLNIYRKGHPNNEICFTGHSLGAALATLAISRFKPGPASLYTFGSPRVGNSTFVKRVLEHSENQVFRFVNNNDLVTHVPVRLAIYQHVTSFSRKIDANGAISNVELGTLDDLKEIGGVTVQLGERLSLLLDSSTRLEDKEAPANLVDHSPARYCMRLRNLLGGIQPLAAMAAGESQS